MQPFLQLTEHTDLTEVDIRLAVQCVVLTDVQLIVVNPGIHSVSGILSVKHSDKAYMMLAAEMVGDIQAGPFRSAAFHTVNQKH